MPADSPSTAFPESPNARQAVRRFSRAAASYEESAGLQAWLAGQLASLIPADVVPASVAEVGCGTGLLTRLLATRWPAAAYLATDPAPGMAERARRGLRLPGVSFQTLRAEDLQVGADWIVSSAALHWADNLRDLLGHLWRRVGRGGGLAFSLMLRGTLGEIHRERSLLFPGNPPERELPALEEVQSARPPGAVVCAETVLTRTLTYPDVAQMWSAIRGTGVTRGPFSPSPQLTPRQVRTLGEALQSRATPAGIPATYRMACLVWRKTAS